jgi:hypothetical protein
MSKKMEPFSADETIWFFIHLKSVIADFYLFFQNAIVESRMYAQNAQIPWCSMTTYMENSCLSGHNVTTYFNI